MKRFFFLLLVLITSIPFLAQEHEVDNNIVKYWHYRTRMQNEFIAIGSEPGESLPFGTRNEREKPILSQGEGPILLGHYIGVLATEYKLLRKNNQDTNQTIKELYYALYAFNRLDLIAETSNGYQKEPKLDGFFVREDFPSDFVEKHPSLNRYNEGQKTFTKGSGQTMKVMCTTDKGEQCCDNSIDKKCKVTSRAKGYAQKYTHIPMSLDQILGVLMGVSLVNELVDPNVVFADRSFQDGESSLKKEAQHIAKRILSYAKKQHWAPKEPDGDYTGDCNFRSESKPNYFKNNTTLYFFPRLLSGIAKDIYGEKYGYFPFVDWISGGFSIQMDNIRGSFYHRRMYIEMMVLSNKDNNIFLATPQKILRKSKKYDWDVFYHTLGTVLHGWEKDNRIKKETLEMLSSAPNNGPYFHGLFDYSKGGWATEDRFTASIGGQYNGSRFPEITGNYIGLDYMLLHNLYLLTYHDAPKSYGELKRAKTVLTPSKPLVHNVEKCVMGKKQSCKERQKYYLYLHDLVYKNKKYQKESTRKKALNAMFQRKFGATYGELKQKCNKRAYKKACLEK